MSGLNSPSNYRALTLTRVGDENAAPISHELVGDANEIGSSPENTIPLDAPDLAPQHLSLRRIEGRDYLLVDLAARWREREWAWLKLREGDFVWCPRHGQIKYPGRRGRCPQCRTRRSSLWLVRPLADGDTFPVGSHYRATYRAHTQVQAQAVPARHPGIALRVPPLPTAPLPTDDSNLWRWQPKGAPFPIFLHQRVNRFVTAHARRHGDREVGGLLLGEVCQDQGGQMYVVVAQALRAEFADETRGHLTFTHKTWQQLQRAREEQYPDQTVVGWYHTHPGWTIFLSHWDLFIHQNFFRDPWQIALVIDPSLDRAGIFVWNDGAVANPQCPVEPFRLAEIDGSLDNGRPPLRIKLKQPG